jgi:DMSO/TMAO reductase YedYZ molybdopterin-dependent catalytic subunit
LVGSSRWTGVRLRDVLRQASLRGAAVDVVFRCADGYTTSIPIDLALDRHTLLAIAQNGRPLRQEHGFPCRVRVPALYGMLNAKWVEEIEVVDFNFKGYWSKRGWSDVGTVRTQSRIDTAPDLRVGESSWIAGVAWAGARGISRVEVSFDGSRTWEEAKLRPPISSLAWTQWAFRWTPRRRGAQRLMCRATDGDGRLQDREERSPHPSGASGYHEVEVEVM